MLGLIKEIKSCLLNDNLRCALGMALTLPDICAHVKYPNEEDSKKRYVDWCEKYLFNQGYLPSHEVDYSKPPDQWTRIRVIEPEICYKLRCAFLHSGNLELNQRKNDDFPVFNLQITSIKEHGIYTGRNMRNQSGEVKETTIDIRLLTRVLCNAAREYYDNCSAKDNFTNYHVNIINIEQEVDQIHERENRLAEMQRLKKDISNYDELTDQAKTVLFMLQNGQAKDVSECVKDGVDAYILAMDELIAGGFVNIPPKEDIY